MYRQPQTRSGMPDLALECPRKRTHAREGRPRSPVRPRGDRAGSLAVFALVLLAGCRSLPAASTGAAESPEPEAVAQQALAATLPEQPVRIEFLFRLREADLRFQGRGVARVEPPYRVRLDLFSSRGETLFEAALVEGELRVPEWAPREMAPPPGLLWAALGVFRPDPEWELLGGRIERDQAVTLRYEGSGGEQLGFRISGGRLVRAELYRGGHLVEEVDLSLERPSGKVLETVYRNRAEFVELTFLLQSVDTVAYFPPDIWNPGR